MAHRLLIYLIFIFMFSCDNTNLTIHKGFENSSLKKTQYKTAVNEINVFFKTYNDKLKSKVHKSFWKDFYFNNCLKFQTKVIFSQNQKALVNIEQKNFKKNQTEIFYSEKHPFLFLQDQIHNFSLKYNIKNGKPLFTVNKDSYVYFYDLEVVGLPIPFNLMNEGSVGIGINLTITTENFITTKIPGVTILYFQNGELDKKKFESIAIKLLDHEIKNFVINSESFKKAMIHPALATIAKKINSRQLAAKNKIEEYPYFEFEKDIQEMRTIAKQNEIEDNYVDNILKDPQYKPIAGSLFLYYSSSRSFMLQWILLNGFFFLLALVMFYLKIEELTEFRNALIFIIIAANGYVFVKKPDITGIIYWIIPMILFLATFILLFFNYILDNLFSNKQ